jgi:hypothetical protein
MTLDDLIPVPHWAERHERVVAAPPDAALAAARAVTMADMPLGRVLLTLRGLRTADEPFTRLLETRVGMAHVSEDPDLWAGALRPWRVRGGSRRVPDLTAFDEPGWVKVAAGLTVAAHHRGALLATETRIAATSDDARRAFGRYWLVVRPGSGVVRTSWLRAAEHRALASLV